jgi:hypothetical protein
MTTTRISNWDQYRGQDLYDSHGDKIGRLDEVFLDDETNEPDWIAVHTGLFGMNQSLVPAANVNFDNGRLITTYSKDEIKDAPNISPTDNHLSVEEEKRLYDHYGRSYTPYQRTQVSQTQSTGNVTTSAGKRDTGRDETAAEATIRNEQVQKTAEVENVRLRKHVWTEQVPVQREEIVVERDQDPDVRR